MQTRKSIFLYTALFYTLYLIFPLFGDMARLPVWLPSMLSVAVMFALYPKAFSNNMMTWFWIYVGVLGFYVIIGKPLTIGIGSVADNKKIFIEFAYILPAIGVFSIFDYLKDFELAKKYFIWSNIILYASFVVAVPLMLHYSSLRAALVEQDETMSVVGLPSYSLMHAYTLLVPVACFAVKMSTGIKKMLSFFALIILCYVIYSTFVTTSLVITIAVIVFAFSYNCHRSSYYTTVCILALVIWVLYEAGFFLWVVDAIYPFFDGTAVQPKLDDFRESMIHGELQGGTITTRQNSHEISLNAFFSSPIWGSSSVGGHSSLLDRLGGLGLLGGIPFVMIFVSFYKMGCRWFASYALHTFFILSLFVGIVFLYQKGNWGSESWLMMMVMMPLSLSVLNFIYSNKNKTK